MKYEVIVMPIAESYAVVVRSTYSNGRIRTGDVFETTGDRDYAYELRDRLIDRYCCDEK